MKAIKDLMNTLFILCLCAMMGSCDVGLEFSGWTQHIYRNNSNYKIELISYTDGNPYPSFSLLKDEENIFDYYGTEGTGNPPVNIPRYATIDSVVTIFNDTLAVSYDKSKLAGNPMRIDNYELVEGEKEPYIYLFEFTEEDYQRALERGRIIR